MQKRKTTKNIKTEARNKAVPIIKTTYPLPHVFKFFTSMVYPKFSYQQ